jgi:hypothetical protein
MLKSMAFTCKTENLVFLDVSPGTFAEHICHMVKKPATDPGSPDIEVRPTYRPLSEM